VSASVLDNPAIDDLLGIDNADAIRLALLAHINDGAQASTFAYLEHPGDYQKNPHGRIVTAMNLTARHSDLNEDPYHELIHGGGVPGAPFVRGMLEGLPGFPYSHDLSKYENRGYKALLAECQNPAMAR